MCRTEENAAPIWSVLSILLPSMFQQIFKNHFFFHFLACVVCKFLTVPQFPGHDWQVFTSSEHVLLVHNVILNILFLLLRRELPPTPANSLPDKKYTTLVRNIISSINELNLLEFAYAVCWNTFSVALSNKLPINETGISQWPPLW